MTQRLACELLIGEGEELRQRLEHGDLRAEPAPHAAKLEPDHARPDHAETLRHRLELQCAPGVDDVRGLERCRAQLDRRGARCEHHVSRTESAARAIVRSEFDLAAGEQAPVTLETSDACGLEQRDDPLGHRAHDAALALLHLREIELDPGRLDAMD